MITIEKSEKIGNNFVFTLSGNIDNVCNGYEFCYEEKNYCVKSVAMVCNKENVKSDSIDVIAELISL